MNELIEALPPYFTPVLIAISAASWLGKQLSDIFLSIPRRAERPSLRRLRLAKEASELAIPGSPEQQYFLRQQRDASIEHAAILHAPPTSGGRILMVGGPALAVVELIVPGGQPLNAIIWITISTLVVWAEWGPRKQRGLIREYLQNPGHANVGDLMYALQRKDRGPRLHRRIDRIRSKRRQQLADLGFTVPELSHVDATVRL